MSLLSVSVLLYVISYHKLWLSIIYYMEKVKNKINELRDELDDILTARDNLQRQLRDMDARVTQIVGALDALGDLLEDEPTDSD